jgi:hypothetical protein
VARLTIRWTRNAGDTPATGEALVRLWSERDPAGDLVIPGGGPRVPLVTIDGNERFVFVGEPQATDLHVSHRRLFMSVETADGRKLMAHFGSDAAAPQIDSDAPADLRAVLNRAWRARKPTGPLPGDGLDIAAIRTALREWEGPWPPAQEQISGLTARRVRQVLHDAETTWEAEVEAVRPVTAT